MMQRKTKQNIIPCSQFFFYPRDAFSFLGLLSFGHLDLELDGNFSSSIEDGDWETWNIIPVLYIYIYISNVCIYIWYGLFMMVYTCFERLALVFGNRIYERLALKSFGTFQNRETWIYCFKRG